MDEEIIERFRMKDWISMPRWQDVTDLPGLLEWMAGCTVLYVEGEELCSDACNGMMTIVKKDGHYVALDFDAWHDEDPEWMYAPIVVRYLKIEVR